MTRDTITAIATPPGMGGVAIVRLSGNKALTIAEHITQKKLPPREAVFCAFMTPDNKVVDEGLAIYFKGPHSFTGEDVVELQGHGGPVVSDQLLKLVLDSGARMARPGEFSERAFLNDKMDLVQAEAVADLINATTTQAAQSAMRSLQGDFSDAINTLLEQLVQIRMFIESAIDFTDEDIDFIAEHDIIEKLKGTLEQLTVIRKTAGQGALLQAGINVVIAGAPNAGKSSLLNCLSGKERAIVTEIAGTTRDVLREQINIDGMPLHIIDTAGLRDTDHAIEQEGVKRAYAEIEKADLILWINDVTHEAPEPFVFPQNIPVIKVQNKIDLLPSAVTSGVCISAKHGKNIEALKQAIKDAVGFQSAESSTFIARRRHLDALDRTCDAIERGVRIYQQTKAHELLAEELRQASDALGEITGTFTTDDLLGKIFSEFCIGK
ncbi:MAG: tRNA uridine-5-carboxymethylaminomethyl(34) synthesis GTPase MnmE [Coxiella sp. (in: Bacteria)]|nr:MAG: tRNA uridine-5-carboxymethylaminomethyl(34) synthesis GTPase MnmE [Coxiella sp. (in: g-proteobacteria)]